MSSVRLLWDVQAERRRQEASSRWSREQLQRHQAAGLQRLRDFVLRNSPFYRRFHHGQAGRPLEALPILDKLTLMSHFDELVTDRQLRLSELEAHLETAPDALHQGRYRVLSTSGSTGQRGVFVFNPEEWRGALGAIARPLTWAKAPPPWTRSALIASGAPWHYSAQVGKALSHRWLPSLRLEAGSPLPILVDQLNDWQPRALAAYPSVVLQLAEEQLAGRLRIPLRHIGTSAERLPEVTRQKVQAAWGIKIYDTYGATEYAPIATECHEGHLHLLEDRAVIEVVDERGRLVPAGEPGARLLLTVLDRVTQPLIRYEISDGLRERPGQCPCGRPFRMLERVEGRAEEVLAFPRVEGGGEVQLHPNLFHTLLERVPATGWQVRRRPDASLSVLLTGSGQPAVPLAVLAQTQALLASRGARASVEVRWVPELPRGATGKAPLIVRERPVG